MAWGNNNGGDKKNGKFAHKENRGSVWDNDHKKTAKHPDFRGTANVAGIIYWVSGWAEMKNGKRMLSLSFQEQEEKPEEPRESRPPQNAQRSQSRSGW